jgi:hypothetical protein
LSTLASTWLTKVGNKVGNGITMLIASASQLAREGLAGYVDSFLETSNRLKMGGGGRVCRVLPAPFIMLGGCNSISLTRSILEFQAWVRLGGLDPGGVLNDTFGVVEHHVRNSPAEKTRQ